MSQLKKLLKISAFNNIENKKKTRDNNSCWVYFFRDQYNS